ncbi:hypothetical protein I316_03667 [Kwoniella heveanensis BCC8398]|uniref:Uncharacterized protein n=1 Tax=Kwoniella heveanensis BCC8398 TaxID=1296120 RepID=A0A1B9GUC2_9TREE|nr:hypothetical protein I316_03667 [Kwoniella heveanensis BCC8398]
MLRGEGDPDSLVDPNGDSRIIKLSNIEVRLDELKSGQVADMIMALKHGSKPVNTATISAENEAAAEKATELEGVKDETDEADEPASSLTSLARSW